MKKFYVLCLLIIIAFSGAFVNAQNLKFGHLNMQNVLVLMPEYNTSLDSLKKMNDKYSKQEEVLQVEFNRKYNDLTANQANMDSLILQSKISELQSMQQNLEAFQQLASDKLQKLQADLLANIMKKLEATVKQIGQELDLIYVFDVSGKNPIYASEKSIDITPMVKEKLKLP
ncbi:MAG: OmpH family outer membrane protein [Bacteroidales bacterium]|nr:OmpH family outer membrane protein [Bacteroidales bacterium]